MHEKALNEQEQIITANKEVINDLENSISILLHSANELDLKVRTLKSEYQNHNKLKKGYISLQKDYTKDSKKYEELSSQIKHFQKLDQDTRKQYKIAKKELETLNKKIEKISTDINDSQSFQDETYQLIKEYVLKNSSRSTNGFLLHNTQEFIKDISEAINSAANLELMSKTEEVLREQVHSLEKYKELYTSSSIPKLNKNITSLTNNNSSLKKSLNKALNFIEQLNHQDKNKSAEIDSLKAFLDHKGLTSEFLSKDDFINER